MHVCSYRSPPDADVVHPYGCCTTYVYVCVHHHTYVSIIRMYVCMYAVINDEPLSPPDPQALDESIQAFESTNRCFSPKHLCPKSCSSEQDKVLQHGTFPCFELHHTSVDHGAIKSLHRTHGRVESPRKLLAASFLVLLGTGGDVQYQTRICFECAQKCCTRRKSSVPHGSQHPQQAAADQSHDGWSVFA